ncbi:DNA-directed RNA polymerase II subunit 3, putative [Bodo saltans]|uniref:DNA-directed RNA polymerase II subunit 3, putative n=1 Tax=Bodo saltans TaxID=75058 RepID=A0A0S4IQS6_BODSA|nr:DNA-directed RNA polymerase II subunit 3, putative [Bodo saltans]|eukprot:CUF22293.1 DNA-directed RNA polymerase II subunit 3, putative [Bodo saltans]
MTASSGRNRALDLCTLVWPELDRPPVQSIPAGHARWLVGWNPRGLVVVGALTIDAPSPADAFEKLQQVRDVIAGGDSSEDKDDDNIECSGMEKIATARGLRILGRIRHASSSSSDDDAAATAATKTLRQSADVWLDLVTPGPTAELFVCGYKVQRFHLHVVHADPNLDHLQLTPAVTSVLSHYGIQGTAMIAHKRGMPHPTPQGQSLFEGRMMPKHLLALISQKNVTTTSYQTHNGLELLRAASTTASSRATDRNGADISIASPHATPSKQLGDSANSSTIRPSLDLTMVGAPNPPNFGSDSFGNGSQLSTPQKTLDTSKLRAPSPASSTTTSKQLIRDAAPRLDFPEQTDVTELSCWLTLCNDGCRIRKMLARNNISTLASAKPSTSSKKESPHVPSSISSSGETATSKGGAKKNVCASSSMSRTPNIVMGSILMHMLINLLPIVTFLARLFYVARMLEYRQREFINWLGLVTGQSTTCGLHPLMPHVLKKSHNNVLQRQSCVRGFFVRVLVDVILGALFAVFLVQHEENIIDSVRNFAWYGLHDLHVGRVDWFRGWPGGFKMNDDLNLIISAFHMTVLTKWEALLDRVSIDWIRYSYLILTYIAPLGASFAMCFVADCCNFVTQHLRMQFHIMEVVYRSFVALISCLFAQFRGRKYNPLRRRDDASEFAMDQMLLGTLLCTAALFLFPTVAMYYFYFALVRTSVWVVQEALLSAALGCSNVPLFHFLFWFVNRAKLPSGIVLRHPRVRSPVALEPSSPTVAKILRSNASTSAASPVPPTPSASQSSSGAGLIVDLTLEVLPMKLSFAMFDHTVIRWTLTRPFTLGKLFRFIILGEEKPCVNPQVHLFPHLMKDPLHPTVPTSK